MPRNLKLALGLLAVAVLIGLISLREMHRRIARLGEMQASEERARHEVLAPPISTPTDVTVKARIFWAAGPDQLAPAEINLPLSADPVQRSRQLVRALLALPPTPAQRTMPADAVLLGFYILPDGTAVADFSDALAAETPSGIVSEQLTVNSLARTLESNVPALRRLKILIHGQEVETLAGNVDLSGFFDLHPPVQSPGTNATPSAPSTPGAGAAASPSGTPPVAALAPAKPPH
ncbi:MAG: GerMN domain-containing protein [Acidobacteriia bacterium]|nr:GerMN domain-containing protein [Terriglobia bacterium]